MTHKKKTVTHQRIEELFVPIEFWERYSVSNYGQVMNTDTGRFLTQRIEKTTGRLKVRFYVLGAYMDFYVDNLVTKAFFLNYKTGIDIYYKNGNKLDCTVLNLSFDPKYGEILEG